MYFLYQSCSFSVYLAVSDCLKCFSFFLYAMGSSFLTSSFSVHCSWYVLYFSSVSVLLLFALLHYVLFAFSSQSVTWSFYFSSLVSESIFSLNLIVSTKLIHLQFFLLKIILIKVHLLFIYT
jgi:hypothetical protein